MRFLYMGEPENAERWRDAFFRILPDIKFEVWPDVGDASLVTYVITWQPSSDLGNLFPNLRGIYIAGAGLDQYNFADIPTTVNLIRLVDDSMAEIMADYVLFAVLALHRDMLAYREQQSNRQWAPLPIVPATERRVGILGAGTLGKAALERLEPLGFQLSAWSQTFREVPGGNCFVGWSQISTFLTQCDILVNLLPLTDETRGILDFSTFSRMPEGAGIVNVGRGAHLVEKDLLQALDSGQLGAAVLDVFASEPLANEHPFWSHPRIMVTPQIASDVQVQGAVSLIARNLYRDRRRLRLLNVVDRDKGY